MLVCIFRVTYVSVILALSTVIVATESWMNGHFAGYEEGIADVVLQKVNPTDYFKKYLKVPR